MAKVGYARVSTVGQSLDVQVEKLKAYGCDDEHIFDEKVSGGKGKKRPALDDTLKFVRKGDSLVITKLDRLARSVSDLTNIVDRLQHKGVDLIVLDQQIDTTTPAGRLTFHLLSAIGEFERDLINERCQEGRFIAQKNGVKFGRKPSLSDKQVIELIAEIEQAEIPKAEIAKRYGISKTTLYRVYGEATE